MYDYISLLLPKASERSCLTEAVDAVSLAYFSTKNQLSDILTESREKYAITLQLLSATTQSPPLAIQNATLVSILLLDLFEKLTQTSSLWSPRLSI